MNKIKIPLLAVVLAVFAIFEIVTGIMQLCAKTVAAPKDGQAGEYRIGYAFKALDTHNIVDNIPLFSEHYYLLFDENQEPLPYALRAEESWYKDNFDGQSGAAKKTVTVKYMVRKQSEQVSRELSGINERIIGVDLPKWHTGNVINEMYFADKTYPVTALAKIGVGAAVTAAYALLTAAVKLSAAGRIKKGGAAAAVMLAVGIAAIAAAVLLFTYIMIMT
ncbi:MAG: hypothetical protein J1F03_04810 [Oscillospiraceae bacterium]|nr:hypothetical protein [Oscillospiraceae bacterium]